MRQINCSIILLFSNLKKLNRKRIETLWNSLTIERNLNHISLELFSIFGYSIAVWKLPTRNLSASPLHVKRWYEAPATFFVGSFASVPGDACNFMSHEINPGQSNEVFEVVLLGNTWFLIVKCLQMVPIAKKFWEEKTWLSNNCFDCY